MDMAIMVGLSARLYLYSREDLPSSWVSKKCSGKWVDAADVLMQNWESRAFVSGSALPSYVEKMMGCRNLTSHDDVGHRVRDLRVVGQALHLVVQEHAVVLGATHHAEQVRHRRQEPRPGRDR
jgi:hypothetical protein